ncbi:hypothetical protein BH11MYX4_BH11MYX4_35390 [soil metagenome]
MKQLRVLAACLTLAACASEAATDEGVEVSSDALVEGHGGIKGNVKVEPTRLVITKAGNEALLASAGRVLVGGPQRSPDNPYGFLRRAVSAAVIDEGHIAITTEEASLSDAVKTGSLRTSHDIEPSSLRIVPMSNGNAARAGNGLDITLGERSLADIHLKFHDPTRLLPVADFQIDRSVRLEHAQVHFEPSVDLSLGIRGGQIDHLEASARGTLEASFALTVDTKTSIDIDLNRAYRETLKGHLRTPPILVTLFETEPYVLPPQWIGFVPVVETVRFRVVLECDIDLVSQMHAEAGASLKTTATFGVSYKNGAWQALAAPTFDAKPSFAMTRSGSVSGLCGIRNEVGFFLYDLAGPTLAVTPYLQFDVGASARGFDFGVAPGVRGTFGGRLNVFGHEFLRTEIPLFDVKARPLVGSL